MKYIDYRIADPVIHPLAVFEEHIAAVAMLLCGCVAILCLAIGRTKKSRPTGIVGLLFLFLSLALLFLRIFVSTFINDVGIDQSKRPKHSSTGLA